MLAQIEDLIQTQAPAKKPNNISVQAKEIDTDSSIVFEALLVRAYQNLSNDTDDWVKLTDIRDEMNALDQKFRSSEYQDVRLYADKVISVAESYPLGVLEIGEKLDHKPVIHYIRIDCEVFRFIEAYKQVPNKEQGGWVLLSGLGTELKKNSTNGSRFSYRGIKQPKKVVIKMSQDYPKIIKIKEKMKGNKAIDMVRVKL